MCSRRFPCSALAGSIDDIRYYPMVRYFSPSNPRQTHGISLPWFNIRPGDIRNKLNQACRRSKSVYLFRFNGDDSHILPAIISSISRDVPCRLNLTRALRTLPNPSSCSSPDSAQSTFRPSLPFPSAGMTENSIPLFITISATNFVSLKNKNNSFSGRLRTFKPSVLSSLVAQNLRESTHSSYDSPLVFYPYSPLQVHPNFCAIISSGSKSVLAFGFPS